jgi:hypothetical protein
MITLIALSRLIAMKGKQRNQNQHKEKEQQSYENKNPSEHIPKPWRDLRVSNNRSCTEPLRLR